MYNCLSAKLVRLFAQPNVDLVNKRVVCSIVGWARASVEEVLVYFFASWYLSALPLPLLLCSPYHYYHGLIVMVIMYCRGRSVESRRQQFASSQLASSRSSQSASLTPLSYRGRSWYQTDVAASTSISLNNQQDHLLDPVWSFPFGKVQKLKSGKNSAKKGYEAGQTPLIG